MQLIFGQRQLMFAFALFLVASAGQAQTPNESHKQSDLLPIGSVWIDEPGGMTLTVLQRDGDTFRARYTAGDSIERLLVGKVSNGRIAWLSKDVESVKGGQGGDNSGTILGDRMTISYGSKESSRTFVLHRNKDLESSLAPTSTANESALDRYAITWDYDARNGRALRTGELLIPVPSDAPYQKVTWELQDVQSHRVIRLNEGLLVAVRPSGNIFRLRVVVEPTTIAIPRPDQVPDMPADARSCLSSKRATAETNPQMAKLAQELKADDPIQTVDNIRRWLTTNIEHGVLLPTEYAHEAGIDVILKGRKGLCAEFSILFVALCCQADVPARIVTGPVRFEMQNLPEFLTGPMKKALPAEKLEGEFMGHGWAEVYIDGWGWIPVDPQTPDFPLGHIPPPHLPMLRFDPMVMISLRSDAFLAQMNADNMKMSFGRLEPANDK
jgi:transglutaminase-like putative cysteine protease